MIIQRKSVYKNTYKASSSKFLKDGAGPEYPEI